MITPSTGFSGVEFSDDYIDDVCDAFDLSFMGRENMIKNEKNVFDPVLIDSFTRTDIEYSAYVPTELGNKYKAYANFLENVLWNREITNLVTVFCENNFTFTDGTVKYIREEMLDKNPNQSDICNQRKSGTKFKKQEDNKEYTCSICLEDIKDGEMVVTFLCGNVKVKELVHKECLGDNILQRCPSNLEINGCY